MTCFHYPKPMANPVMIPSSSAVSNSVKFNSYREEAKRILRNTSPHLPWSHKADLLSEFSSRMKLSGYNESFRSKIISEGIRGHIKKVISSHREGTSINRSGQTIRESKLRRKKNRSKWFQEGKNQVQYNTVLFVPATDGSKLAKILRRHEEQNMQGRTSRIRIVERSGRSVKDILTRNYPWPTRACSDLGCFPCSTGKKYAFSCRIPGAGYTISCTTCEQQGLSSVYYGETGHNLYTRGGKHLQEFNQGLSTNCMVIHNSRYHHHDPPDEFNFRMDGVSLFSSALDRQIDESLRIHHSNAYVTMNSGSEWRMDAIPRARVAKPSRPQ